MAVAGANAANAKATQAQSKADSARDNNLENARSLLLPAHHRAHGLLHWPHLLVAHAVGRRAAALLVAGDYERGRLGDFELAAYLLDLRCLFLKTCCERFNFVLLPRDGRF